MKLPPENPIETALDNLLVTMNLEARTYQRRIVIGACARFLGQTIASDGTTEPPARSVLIESPTGSGKTVMGLLIARLLQERLGLRTGWAAMRRNLLSQTAAENETKLIGVAPLIPISMFDRQPPRGVDLLVVDEAQHDAAASMAHLHNTIRPRFILGLTATPFRVDRLKLCFDAVLRDAGIHRLIQDGYLSPYDHYTIPEFSVQSVANYYLSDPQRWGKSIAFFRTVAECYQLESMLKSRGVLCEVVTGTSDRDAQIERFRSGRTTILINCMVLTEGFDCPDLETVFCRDSSRGPTMQMCGRAFRRHPNVPVKKIVQSRLSKWPFTKVATAQQQWLWQEDEWRSLTINPLINAVSGRVRLAIARGDVRLPALLHQSLTPAPWGEAE